MTKTNIRKIEELIKELLIQIGEDPDREGIVRTPERVANAWDFFSSGYSQDLDSIINNAVFTEDYDEMVTIKDIDFLYLKNFFIKPM